MDVPEPWQVLGGGGYRSDSVAHSHWQFIKPLILWRGEGGWGLGSPVPGSWLPAAMAPRGAQHTVWGRQGHIGTKGLALQYEERDWQVVGVVVVGGALGGSGARNLPNPPQPTPRPPSSVVLRRVQCTILQIIAHSPAPPPVFGVV